MFHAGLELEPTYARAHAGSAHIQAIRAVLSMVAPHSVMPGAKQDALKAMAIDEALADAHTVLGFVHHWYEWDWSAAEQEYRRALELGPGDAFARSMYAHVPGAIGRVEDSVAEARSAVERDPLSSFSRCALSLMLPFGRRFGEAIAEARAGIELARISDFAVVPYG